MKGNEREKLPTTTKKKSERNSILNKVNLLNLLNLKIRQ